VARRSKPAGAPDPAAAVRGAVLRRAREDARVTLTDLAHRLSYSVSYVSGVETGALRAPAELVSAYERALDMPSGELARRVQDESSRYVVAMTDPVSQFLAQMHDEGAADLEEAGEEAAEDDPPLDASRLVLGRDAVFRAACRLVEEAANEDGTAQRTVLVASQGRADALGAAEDLSKRWRRAVNLALARGCDVVHLVQLDQQDERGRLAIVQGMLAFIGFASRYQPYAVPQNAGLVTPHDFLVVPNCGALIFFSTRKEEGADTAFYYARADADYLGALHDHARALRFRSMPVLRVYDNPAPLADSGRPSINLLAFDFAYTQAELQEGERFLVKDGFSSLSFPEETYLARVDRLLRDRDPEWRDWLRTLVDNRLLRAAAFREQLKAGWRSRDICSKRGIERLVNDGLYAADDWIEGWSKEKASDAEIALQLETVIGLLRAHPNYELALYDPGADGEASLDISETFWLIRGKPGASRLFLETYRTRGERRFEIDVEVTDRVVAEAFREFFLRVWDRLPPANREKPQVIAWLEEQLQRVRARAAG
jgi:transcriptional regulator with XRE-family HTH domain